MDSTQEPIVRNYQPDDLEQIRQLHTDNGFDFRFPDLGDPLFLIRKVMVAQGKVIAVVVMRIELETMLWLDTTLSPAEKVAAMQVLQPLAIAEAWSRGIDNVVAWVPAHVEEKFAKRLTLLGWSRDRDGWHSWSRPTTKDGQ